MSKSNAFENDWMRLVFNAEPIVSLASNATASPLTSLFVGLHTADPGEAGDQSTSEATYTGYARVSVLRSAAGWTVSGNSVTNATDVVFPVCTAGSNSITHFSVGTNSVGGGKILYRGTLSGGAVIGEGVRPEFAPGAITITEE